MMFVFIKKIFLIIPIFIFAVSIPAQDTSKSKKDSVPKDLINKEILRVNSPKGQEITLQNGLRVLVVENHQAPIFSMQLVILNVGISDQTTHQLLPSLLRAGTQKWTSKEIDEQIDSLGITFNTQSDILSSTSSISVTGLVKNLHQTLDVIAEVVKNPVFPQIEVERFKNQHLSQIQSQRSASDFLAREKFNQIIYNNHPAAFTSPSADSLAKISSTDLKNYHDLYYRPNNSLLVIISNTTLKEIAPIVKSSFGDWKAGNIPKTIFPPASNPLPLQIHLIDRPNSTQTSFRIGNLSLTRNDSDYYAMHVLNRIFNTIRLSRSTRGKGYTYGISSGFSAFNFRGLWTINGSVGTEVTGDALREIMKELKLMSEEKVSSEELEDAKRSITGIFGIQMEQRQTILDRLVAQKLYNLPDNYWSIYTQKIAAVKAEDIQRVARKIIDLEYLQIVAVGDASKIRKPLESYGMVTVYQLDRK